MKTLNPSRPLNPSRRKPTQIKFGISRATQDTLEKSDPTFPKPIRLSERAAGYLRQELQTWAENCPRVVSSPTNKHSKESNLNLSRDSGESK